MGWGVGIFDKNRIVFLGNCTVMLESCTVIADKKWNVTPNFLLNATIDVIFKIETVFVSSRDFLKINDIEEIWPRLGNTSLLPFKANDLQISIH
jgi:hypothetical protein